MPDRNGTKSECSIIVPTRANTGLLGVMGSPNMRTSPALAARSPTSTRSVVVLPAPFGPSKPQT